MPKYDPYQKDCPSRRTLDRIGDRWTILVVGVLAERTHRYSELQRRIEGVSPKMLTATLRSLEHDGLVKRTVHPSVPPQVEYALTDLGRSLQQPIAALERWAIENMDAVLAARAEADQDQRRPRD